MRPTYCKKENITQTTLFKMVLCHLIGFTCFTANAQQPPFIVEPAVYLIDGSVAPYNAVHPGDTIFLRGGNRDKLLIRNFTGSSSQPIYFANKDTVVSINTDSYYGLSINNCKYIRITGQGTKQHFYGIQIKRVADGSGIGIGGGSSDFEIDHLSIENCHIGGIYAKTDPDCSFLVSREKFTQFNTSIHDNYIARVGDEGMYIGSSQYLGQHLTCNGKDTIVLPPILDKVSIYNNIVEYTGWDGIQVSSAPLHCNIYNNTVAFDSQSETPNQMSGILMGGGSKCNCYNNLISNGKGDGIEDHGLGGNIIYNNIIVNAGANYLPYDRTQMKYGIFLSDVSVMKDSSFYIYFNDIIQPKSDGIRIQSVKSKNNEIASNLIIDPGNYLYYEQGNTSFRGKDAYIMIPNSITDVQIKNNFFSRNIINAGISNIDYTVLPGSPLINHAYPAIPWLSIDFRNHRRPCGGLFDIGAMEFDTGIDSLQHSYELSATVFPNPVHSTLTIRHMAVDLSKTVCMVYKITGELIMQSNIDVIAPGWQDILLKVDALSPGVYIYSVRNGTDVRNGKFIKI